MNLKAPGIITFLVSIVLTVFVLTSKVFNAEIPMLENNEFWALLVAQTLLVLACLSSWL